MSDHRSHEPLVLPILAISLLVASLSCGLPQRASPSPEPTATSPSRPAEPTRAESPALSPTTPPTDAPVQEPTPESAIYFVTDEFDAVVYVIPTEWGEYLTNPWQEQGEVIGSTITASSDLQAFLNWGAPGVTISVSSRLDRGYIQMMDEFRDVFAEPCEEYQSRWEVETEFYRGLQQRFWRCGGSSGPTLDLLALVDKQDPQAFTAMMVIVWFYPVEYQLNEDYLLSFIVLPENLP